MARHRLAAGCALLFAAIGVARAQEKPLFVPIRDVTVTYRLTTAASGAAAPGREAHMYFSAALNKLRLDEPAQKGYAVIDRGAQQMLIVMVPQHVYSVLPFDPEMASGFILNDKMQFTRAARATVAGLACTTWNVVSDRASGTVCVTDDGVLLSGRGRQSAGTTTAGLDAVAVSYSAQPASLFAAPPDFVRIDAPKPPRR